jgi:hypothetical protein
MVEVGASVWRVRVDNASTGLEWMCMAVPDMSVLPEVAARHPDEDYIQWLDAHGPTRVKSAGYGDWIPREAVVSRNVGTLLAAPGAADDVFVVNAPPCRTVSSDDDSSPAPAHRGRRKRPRVTSPTEDGNSTSDSSVSDDSCSRYEFSPLPPLFAARSTTTHARAAVETAINAAFNYPPLVRAILDGETWQMPVSEAPRTDACAVCLRQRVLTYNIFGPALRGNSCKVGADCKTKMVIAMRAAAKMRSAEEVEKVLHAHVDEAHDAVHQLTTHAEDMQRMYGGGGF